MPVSDDMGGGGRLDDRVPYLARIDERTRNELLALGREMSYPARAVLLRESEPSSHVLLIRRGWLKVTSTAVTGHEALLALRGPGDVVGEGAALNGAPRSATVSALERVEATVISAERFTGFLQDRPQAALHLLSLISDRLRTGDRRRLEYGASTVEERLSRLLLELAERHGERADGGGVVIRVPLTQQELAGAIGASREAVTRTLRVLRTREVVVTRRRHLVVLRPEVLRRIGGAPAGAGRPGADRRCGGGRPHR